MHSRSIARFLCGAASISMLGSFSFQAQARTVQGVDRDGDGRADVAVYRPLNARWFVTISNGGESNEVFGNKGDIAVPGDYDGDGRTDLAVFHPSNGFWFINHSSGIAPKAKQWGLSGDVPVPADYDGDGKTDLAVYRPSSGYWYLINSRSGLSESRGWGLSDDVPLPGDYNGDGRFDFAVYRPSLAQWHILLNGSAQTIFSIWGDAGDVPVVADFDGDWVTDTAIYRPRDGYFHIKLASGLRQYRFVGANQIPIVGDYDGDGKADPAVWNTQTSLFTISLMATNVMKTEVLGFNDFTEYGRDVPLVSTLYAQQSVPRIALAQGTWCCASCSPDGKTCGLCQVKPGTGLCPTGTKTKTGDCESTDDGDFLDLTCR